MTDHPVDTFLVFFLSIKKTNKSPNQQQKKREPAIAMTVIGEHGNRDRDRLRNRMRVRLVLLLKEKKESFQSSIKNFWIQHDLIMILILHVQDHYNLCIHYNVPKVSHNL